MLELEVKRLTNNIIEAVKSFDHIGILRNMRELEDLVGEETAEVIFKKIEAMLSGE